MSNLCSEIFNIIYLFGGMRSNTFHCFTDRMQGPREPGVIMSLQLYLFDHVHGHQEVLVDVVLLSSFILCSSLTSSVAFPRFSLLRALTFLSF